MEGAQRWLHPAAGLGWNDVRSWDSYSTYLTLTSMAYRDGWEACRPDTSRSLVYVNQEHRLIVTIGVEDLVVVDTGDVLLVCHKDQAQKVRNIVDHLKKTGEPYT
jgi:mannose-1-phosphate guanylyltransferase